jgi:hypothetical protein
MKLKTILAGALALGFAGSAFAQTEITITGATAFRQATMRAILDAFGGEPAIANNAVAVATDFAAGNNAATNLSQLLASNRSLWVGSWPGLGPIIIRTSFNGSTEGLNAIAGNNNPSFYSENTLAPTGAIQFSYGISPADPSKFTTSIRPRFSFSDVYQSTSPVQNEILNPAGSSAVGVVTFTMLTNNGAPSTWTNVTQQQFKALLQQGAQRLSLFTGNASDTTPVYATGRNDGSGTRSAYLTEIGYGVANAVNQYVATANGTATPGVLSRITLVPAGGNGTGNLTTSGGASNASTLWGNDSVGNGGYSSNSGLRSIMSRSSTNVTVFNGVSQTPVYEGPCFMLVWTSTSDARNVITTAPGGKLLGFNGSILDSLNSSSTLSAADIAKVSNGVYSAWSYQHLYYHGTLSSNEETWYNSMKTTYIPAGLTATGNGLTLAQMNTSRPDDGFPIVTPFP